MCSVPKTNPSDYQHNANEVKTVGSTSTADSSLNSAGDAAERSRSAALASQNIMTPTTGLGIANTQKKTMLGM